jgi:hypothetical protein
MMTVVGRFVYRWKRMSSHYARSGGLSAIVYARQRFIMRPVYPDGFQIYDTLRSKYRNIGSSKKMMIIPQFSRIAFSTRRSDPDMRQCNTIDDLIETAYDHLSTISPRGMAAFWSLLVKHVQNHRGGNSRVQLNEQLAEILCNTLENMKGYSSRDIATIAISLAKIMKQVEPRGQRAATGSLHRILHDLLIGGDKSENKHYIFSEIAVHATPILSKFDARSLSNLIYSFGHAEYVPTVENDRTILDVLALEVMSKLQHFNCQELSNMLWSYAKMKSSNSVLFKAAGDSIVGVNDLGEFKPQDFSNILWSFATAGESHPKLYSKLGDHIVVMKDLGQFKPQELSNLIWAYATAGESHPKLFSKIADHIVVMKDLNRFDPQALSNIIWAHATAGESHPKLFEKVADHIVRMRDLSSFLPQHFSNILWSCATTAGKSHPKLFSKFGDHIIAMKDLSGFMPQNLSNILWSYATAGQSHPLLFQKLAVVAIARSNEFNSQGIANLLWAYATVGQTELHLFTSFAPAVKSILGQCNNQDLANVAWAYAVANVNDPVLFNTDFVTALQAKVNGFVPENLSQLYQWHLWQDEIKSGINLPPALRKECRQAVVSESYQSSRFQDDVISVLSFIGMLPEEEVLTPSGYRLDALVEVNGEKIGIEVDGPYHFVNQEPTGSTLLKRRQVSTLDNIPIVSVPYWEWDKLGNDRAKKQMYLRIKLGLS